MDSANLSPTTFANKIDIQPAQVSHITSGRNKPSLDIVDKILRAFPGLRYEWLVRGEGSMYNTPKTTEYSQPALFELDDDTKTKAEVVTEAEAQAPYYKKGHQEDGKTEETDGNAQKKAPETEPSSTPVSAEKQVKKVIVLYTDNTFSEYEMKRI
ncbi:MAG: helix-turn-helix transcriptional regulator [Paludibacteraceae bacterium]|nr:helix-turn-helix transcriptional regulator [Paludibacteraceae bacterium]